MVIDEIRNIAVQAATPELQAMENLQPVTEAGAVVAEESRSENSPESASLKDVSPNELEEAISSLNQAVSLLNHRLNFRIDNSTGRLIAKVIDSKTNDVIKEVPPERVLAFVRRFQEFLGLLVDEKA